MKKIPKKTLIVIVIILIIVFVATITNIIYSSIDKEKNLQGIDQTEVENHYTEEYLLKNHYIKKADSARTSNITCTKANDDQGYVYLSKNGNIYLNVCNVNNNNPTMESKEFYTSVTDIKKIYYNKLKRDLPYYEIVIIDSNNDAYYSAIAYNSDKKEYVYDAISGEGLNIYKDYKIENISSIYIQSIEKSKYYFDEDTSLIFAQEDGTLKMFSSLREGKLVNIKDRIPYFDYVCANDEPICKETTIYITFDNKLVANYNLTETIKNENGDELTIRDAFSKFEILDKDYKYKQMYYNDNFEFKYTIYLLSSDNNLYKVDLDRKKIDSKKVPIATIYQKGIDTIEHQAIPNTIFENTTIIYKNGQKEVFENIFNSTRVDRH